MEEKATRWLGEQVAWLGRSKVDSRWLGSKAEKCGHGAHIDSICDDHDDDDQYNAYDLKDCARGIHGGTMVWMAGWRLLLVGRHQADDDAALNRFGQNVDPLHPFIVLWQDRLPICSRSGLRRP